MAQSWGGGQGRLLTGPGSLTGRQSIVDLDTGNGCSPVNTENC